MYFGDMVMKLGDLHDHEHEFLFCVDDFLLNIFFQIYHF